MATFRSPQRDDRGGWTEVFIHADEAAKCGSAADSVARGHSLLLVPSLATQAEVDALLAAAQKSAAKIREGAARSEKSGALSATLACRLEQPVVATYTEGRTRMPVKTTFHRAIREQCDELLFRAIEIADEHLPDMVGGDLAAALRSSAAPQRPAVTGSPLLEFTHLEPAINLYTSGGDFAVHRDLQHLTILIVLSDSDAFTGGGTAFWARAPSNAADEDATTLLPSDLIDRDTDFAPPAVVLSPPRGTALLWAGDVTHAAQQVTAGERAVLVASLSRLDTEIMGNSDSEVE